MSLDRQALKTFVHKMIAAERAELGEKGIDQILERGRQWTLLYSEAFKTRSEAMSREWHLKRDRALRKRLRRLAQLKSGSEA